MRTSLALLLALAGATTTGAAVVHSDARIHPTKPWSLRERLFAVRVDRALPASVATQATFSLRGGQAVLKVRDASGPMLIKCPAAAGAVASALASRDDGRCETQAVDEAGDVLVYEVSGRVAPLCPGQYTTLTEQQLHNALYLPALGDGGVLEPGRLDLCRPGEANCAMSKGAGLLLYCGEVRTCAQGACFEGGVEIEPDDVATSLYYAQALSQARTPASVAPAACGAVPMSVHLSSVLGEAVTATTVERFIEAQPWNATPSPSTAEGAGDLRSFFQKHPRGICLMARGIDVERPREAEMALQSMAFPVFAPFDPRSKGRATPLLRSLQRAAANDEAMTALLGRCDLTSERACQKRRERVAAQLRNSIGKLQPGLSNLAADELPYHVGASGPFHLADADPLHVTLESEAEVAKAKGVNGKLSISYQPLWPESVAEKRASCARQPGICLFRALWHADGAQLDLGEDGFESLVALFARRDANTRCVRRLFNALSAAGEGRKLELQRDLREPVAAGENRSACDPRSRGATGLVPRGDESASCTDETTASPFGETDPGGCRPISLVYVQEEPWAAAAQRIASIAADAQVGVSVSGIKSSEVHRGSLGSWDVLLTVASNYYNRKYPTLVPLLHPSGNQNLSGGQATSDAPGRQFLGAYEASIVYPAPAWLGVAAPARPASRAEMLRLLEDDVAKNGPAPIYPLAFLRPATLAIPATQAEAARSPWYFARLVQNWSGRP